jgi:hypothetical protein
MRPNRSHEEQTEGKQVRQKQVSHDRFFSFPLATPLIIYGYNKSPEVPSVRWHFWALQL